MERIGLLGALSIAILVSCGNPVSPGAWTTGPRGMDISHHNIDGYGGIDWARVRAAGCSFAFVKASEGDNWKDPTFAANIAEGRASGITMGAYHYARPDLNPDPALEAEWFLQVAESSVTAGHLRPALDVETGFSLGKVALAAWISTWMETVIARTGVVPIIYVSGDSPRILDASIAQYDLWIGSPSSNSDVQPSTGIWSRWAFWQYTNTGSVPGVPDPDIDLDLFNGDATALKNGFVIR